MGAGALVLGAMVVAAAGHPAGQGVTVAVMGFAAREGVGPHVAQVLTENAARYLQESGRFSRVVNAADVQLLLTLEAQKQMTSCDTAGCVAEIAGALGTDLVCTGSVARVGRVTVLNVRMLSARNGQTVASAGENLQAEDPGEVVLLLPTLLGRMMGPLDAYLKGNAAPQVATTDAPPSRPWSMRGILLGVSGALGGVVAVVGVVVGILALAGAVSTLAISSTVPGSQAATEVLQAGFLGGAGLAVLSIPVVLVSVAVAVGGLVAAVVFR
jgi:hypothetical protein